MLPQGCLSFSGKRGQPSIKKSCSRYLPEFTFRYLNIKPYSLPRLTVLSDGNAGKTQNLPDQEEPAEWSWFTASLKDLLLFRCRNPIPVILVY